MKVNLTSEITEAHAASDILHWQMFHPRRACVTHGERNSPYCFRPSAYILEETTPHAPLENEWKGYHMNGFIKKIVVVALVITSAGVAAASQARADSVQFSSGYWTGGSTSGVSILGFKDSSGSTQFSLTLKSGSDRYAKPNRRHGHKKIRNHHRGHKAKRHHPHRQTHSRSHSQNWAIRRH